MRLAVGGRTYDMATIDQLTIADIIRLNAETAALGLNFGWSEYRKLMTELEGQPFDAVADRADFPLVMGLMLWAVRRNAGEDVTFLEACQVSAADLHFVADPEDARPPKARTGKQARKGSGRADVSAPAVEAAQTPSS